MLVHKDAPIGRDAALKAVVWLKRNFGREIEAAVKGSAYSVDTICGIACQETAYFWVNVTTPVLHSQSSLGRALRTSMI